jgi:hypothetical protein
MSCLPSTFANLEPEIRNQYQTACADAGIRPSDIPLSIEETTLRRKEFKSEFMAVTPPPSVRITWNGIASLWAFAQALNRVASRMFRAASPLK